MISFKVSKHAIKSTEHKNQKELTQEVWDVFDSRRLKLRHEDDGIVPRPWENALT